MAIRAVLWDADGVLQEGVLSWPDAIGDFVEDLDAFGAAVWGRLEPALTGSLDMGVHLDEVIERQGLAAHRTAIRAVWGAIDPLPESLAVVDEVRAAGTPCYLATNQDTLRAWWMRSSLGYDALLDGAYYSCELGAAKPDAAYFQRVAADLRLEPADLLFVDDQPENVAGARAVGLSAELWHRDHGIPVLRERLVRHGVL